MKSESASQARGNLQASKKSSRRPRSRKRPREYLAERAYRELRQDLITGKFRPGERLKEETLVKRLGVSRSVVRQVLIRLTSEGLLEDEPKKGKAVTRFTEEKLVRLIPIRIALEQLAVREAIANATREDEKQLKELAQRLLDPDLDVAEQDHLDVALHQKIWQMAQNEELEKLLVRVVGPFHLMGNAALLSPYYRPHALGISIQRLLFEREASEAGHQPLVDAICQKDVAAATEAITKHVLANWEETPGEFFRKIGKSVKKYLNMELDAVSLQRSKP